MPHKHITFATMKALRNFLERIKHIAAGTFVIADAKDNSITLSRALFERIKGEAKDEAKVFVFRIKGSNEYAFMLNPKLSKPTQLADIQYNAKHRCVGFECLVPTVNRIFYDYGLRYDTRVKLRIREAKDALGRVLYIMCEPKR